MPLLQPAQTGLHSQLKELLAQRVDLLSQLHLAELSNLRGGHAIPPPAWARLTNRVRMGSLLEAIRIASLAIPSGTPSISNRIRPRLTTATHCSGIPLPRPMRVSAGFFVIGLSGETRRENMPPALTCPGRG